MDGPTKKQNQLIHILEQQLISKGLLDEGGYRLLLMGWFGRESSKDLSHEEASFLIDQLIQMGGVISPAARRGRRMGRVRAGASREEGSIEGLRNEVVQIATVRYGRDFEKPLEALCRRLNIADYRTMDVRHGKVLKRVLLRLQTEGSYRYENSSLKE